MEHERLKAAAYLVSKRCGYHAQLEASGAGWRADVLITNPQTGEQSALEIQKSDQKNHETRERIQKHHNSGIRSIWFFLKKENYDEIPPDLMSRGLPAFLLYKKNIDEKVSELNGLLAALLEGRMVFDQGTELGQVPLALIGYDYPCGRCQGSWYRPSFVVSYPNRVRGGLAPEATVLSQQPYAERLLASLEQKVCKPVGRLRTLGAGDPAALVCPHCGTEPEGEFLNQDVAAQCPHPVVVGSLDLRRHFRFKPGWRGIPPSPEMERVLETQVWERIIQNGIAGILSERERMMQQQEAQRRRVEEQARLRMEAQKAALLQRELNEIRDKLGQIMSDEELRRWLIRPLPEMLPSSPQMTIDIHIEKFWNLSNPPLSKPILLLAELEQGGIVATGDLLGLTQDQIIRLRLKARQRHRALRLGAAQGIITKSTAYVALLVGDLIDRFNVGRLKKGH